MPIVLSWLSATTVDDKATGLSLGMTKKKVPPLAWHESLPLETSRASRSCALSAQLSRNVNKRQ